MSPGVKGSVKRSIRPEGVGNVRDADREVRSQVKTWRRSRELRHKNDESLPPKKFDTTSLEARPKAKPPIPPKAKVEERGI